ncbi:hypothetical protein MKW92_014436 [Papaver armeniacum]|nr:hypothetical protein MKW92_014436 [Papaver armeniacum]
MRSLQGSWHFLVLMILSFSISNNSCAQGKCLSDQKALLLQLNQSLISSGFSSKRSSWSLSTDCCSSWQGIKCDKAGHIISLDLSREYIIGGLNDSSSLFNFQHLERLNLADTGLYNKGTPFPSGFSKLANLNYLNLSYSVFSGQIPIEISRMTRLVTLDLSSPDYRGLILNDPDLEMLTRNLKGLKMLSLDGVNISAQVPEHFSEFRNLTSLHLSGCGLYGKFPEKILRLQKLRSLGLSDNDLLQVSLPEFPTDGQLEELFLSSTGIGGEIPSSIGRLTFLSRLDLSWNVLKGSIPNSFSKLKNLQHLDLSANYFTGSISTRLSKFNQLRHLDLSRNSFTGHLSEFFIGSSSPLEWLDLSHNQLQGLVPVSIFEFSKMNTLRLGSNNFSDSKTVQVHLHKLRNLTDLDLSNIKLSMNTTIDKLALFPQLKFLTLSSCHLTEFPTFLENQFHLVQLDLSSNQIRGKIPNWIWKIGNHEDPYGLLESLSGLDVSNNFLEDPAKPLLLTTSELHFHSNLLRGKIPIITPSAYFLDYSFNNFTSMISSTSFNVSKALFFSISNNQISGKIPISICEGNYGFSSGIEYLDLSHNNFSGLIPPCILSGIPEPGLIQNLKVVNLRSNNLQGSIPDAFPESCELQKLDLNGNKLVGKLPRSIANCTALKVLDVGNNRLTGNFADQLGSMPQLHVLILRSNRLYGPWGNKASESNFQKLQIIDVSFNNFSGIISKQCFSSWNGMMVNKNVSVVNPDDPNDGVLGFGFEFNDVNYHETVTVTIKGVEMEVGKILDGFTTIDFSSNHFQGEIPESIGNLTLLYTLNLSRNAFTGTIPSTIGNLTHLESLDFSRNKLVGEIPVQLTDLSYLAVLDLSFNKLVGKIPSGNQFQTFNSTAFEGNYGLCGFPLVKNCSSTSPQNVLKSKDGFDWVLLVVTFLGFVVGASMVFGPQYFWKKGREWVNERINKILGIA